MICVVKEYLQKMSVNVCVCNNYSKIGHHLAISCSLGQKTNKSHIMNQPPFYVAYNAYSNWMKRCCNTSMTWPLLALTSDRWHGTVIRSSKWPDCEQRVNSKQQQFSAVARGRERVDKLTTKGSSVIILRTFYWQSWAVIHFLQLHLVYCAKVQQFGTFT